MYDSDSDDAEYEWLQKYCEYRHSFAQQTTILTFPLETRQPSAVWCFIRALWTMEI